MDRIHLDMRTSTDGNLVESIFCKMHIGILYGYIVSNLADGIAIDRKHISRNIRAVGAKKFCVGFFYLCEIEALQRHLDFRINDDGDRLNAFESFA